MKKLTSILLMGLTIFATSCMDDFDTPNTDNYFGDNTIGEPTTTIAALKTAYASTINGSSYAELPEGTIIEGVITGDDVSGNLYQQLCLQDGTGGIILGIRANGLYANVPTGQKIRLNCSGLYIGGYGSQAQIGGIYNGSIGRMEEQIWKSHVRLMDRPSLNNVPEPIDFSTIASDKTQAGCLVVLKNVTIAEANGKAVFAPDDGSVTLTSNYANRTISGADASALLRTSIYANFSEVVMPKGKVNITGIATRFRNDWQILMRDQNDIEEVK